MKKVIIGVGVFAVTCSAVGGWYYQYSKSQEIKCFDKTAQNLLGSGFTTIAATANSIDGLYNITVKADNSNVYTLEKTKNFLKCNLSEFSLIKNNESDNGLVLKSLNYSIRLSDDGKQEVMDVEKGYLTSEYFIESFFYWSRQNPESIKYDNYTDCGQKQCYPFDLYKESPEFLKAINKVFLTDKLQELIWWSPGSEPVGPTSPLERITIDKNKYLGFSVCKPHDCADNSFYFLYSLTSKMIIARYSGIDNSGKSYQLLINESGLSPLEKYAITYHGN